MGTTDFGNKLIEVRKLKGLTQGDVAEKCNITIRTIQRIESGAVKPRASTIKIISESLDFDYFATSGADVEDQSPRMKSHNLLWHVRDLFNLKTNAMKKITILSTSALVIILLFVNILSTTAQSDNKDQRSLTIQLNEDSTISRVEAVFSRNMTLDSLVKVKDDLQAIGITIHYKKIEFDVHNLLTNLDCEVICNDGFSGSFGTGNLISRTDRVGFYRDYSPDSISPFGTGRLE